MEKPVEGGTVGYIARELDAIAEALRGPQPPKRQAELYAAQQALSWSLDPMAFSSPLAVILEDRGVALNHTPGD